MAAKSKPGASKLKAAAKPAVKAKPAGTAKPAAVKAKPAAAKAAAKKPAAKPTPAPKRATAPDKATQKADLAAQINELQREANTAFHAGKLDRVVRAVKEWRAMATTKPLREAVQEWCQGRGNQLLWKQKWAGAAAIYDAGIAAFKEGDDTRLTAEMLAESGFSTLQLHQLDEAEAKIRRSLELHDTAKRPAGGANAVYYLSNVLFDRGQIDKAVELARDAVKRSHDAGDERGEAFHAYALARALYEQGHTLEAEAICKEAIPVAKSMGLGAVEGNLMNMVANVALDDHRLDESKHYYERAIELFRSEGLKNHEAISISNLGNLAWDEGRLEDALASYEAAIKLHGKVKDDRSTAIGLTARAGVLVELGKFDEAQANLERALAVMMQQGHERRVSFVRAGFARLAEARGQLSEARCHYAEAEISLDSVGDSVEIGRMLYATAGIEADLGDPESAEGTLARAAAMDPASLSTGTAPAKGEQRAGMAAVRALRELAIARIELARAKRASGSEAAAYRAAAVKRLAAIENAKDSLVERSSEVRRIAMRVRELLAADAPKRERGTALQARYRGKCPGKAKWKVDFTADVTVTEADGEMIVQGSLAFRNRKTVVELRGPASAGISKLTGTMTERTTVWKLEAELERTAAELRGRLIEVYDTGGSTEMCELAWPAVA